MNPFGGIVQKAFYLGMGLASLAGEKASSKLGELRDQATKLADDLVARGEMTTDEARKFVDDLIQQAQQPQEQMPDNEQGRKAPRTIEILNDDENLTTANPDDVQNLRDKVQDLQEELKKMRK